MMKSQKIQLFVFLVMFLVPEILFSFVLSFVLFFFRTSFPYLMGRIFGEQFFTDNKIYLFLFLIIEIIGIGGLLYFNFKYNKKRAKLLISIFLSVLFILSIFLFFVMYSMKDGIGF